MLKIRPAQMKVFEEAALLRFEDEMVVHSKEFTPRLCEVLGDEQLRVALRQAMSRSTLYGFTNRGPMRLYIELMFLCGSAFDTDPQYPWADEILRASGDQMARAEELCAQIIEYQDRVSGPEARNTLRALHNLLDLTQTPLTVSSHDFVVSMQKEMTRVYPEKAAYIAVDGLEALILEGRAEARKYEFLPVRGEVLVVALMFAFGHGCTEDPLYPWIARTLQDERIKDSAARADRLEKKAVTWLKHVLDVPREGAMT